MLQLNLLPDPEEEHDNLGLPWDFREDYDAPFSSDDS